MELYKYSLIGFDDGVRYLDDGEPDELRVGTPRIRTTVIKHAIVMPNAFYIPLLNGFDILPIEMLGMITITHRSYFFYHKEYDEYPSVDCIYDLYLPYRDFPHARTRFSSALDKAGYFSEAQCVRDCKEEKLFYNKEGFFGNREQLVRDFDRKMGRRKWF